MKNKFKFYAISVLFLGGMNLMGYGIHANNNLFMILAGFAVAVITGREILIETAEREVSKD